MCDLIQSSFLSEFSLFSIPNYSDFRHLDICTEKSMLAYNSVPIECLNQYRACNNRVNSTDGIYKSQVLRWETAPAENTRNQCGDIIQMRRMNAHSPRLAAVLLVQSKTSVTDD